MRAELHDLLNKITFDPSATKNEVKSLDDAKDALVWVMRRARLPLYQGYLPLFYELINELITLYPALVNAKLSFAENIKDYDKIEILPLDNQLPHTEGEYLINVVCDPFNDTLRRCKYRNYALCTPAEFARIYDLKPIQALLEADPVFKAEAKGGEYPLNSINYYKRKQSLASSVRNCWGQNDVDAYCNLECSDTEAEEILVELLQKATRHPSADESYARIIKELIKKHPQMNLNLVSNYSDPVIIHSDDKRTLGLYFYYPDAYEKLYLQNPDAQFVRAWTANPHSFKTDPSGLRHLSPEYAPSTSTANDLPPYIHIYFNPFSPLRRAARYNLKSIMGVLLSQPTIDLTADSIYRTAYDNETRKILRKAAVKQFYREALAADPSEIKSLMHRFRDFDLLSSDLRRYIHQHVFPEIMMLIDTIDDVSTKFEILDAKKSDIFKESALTKFLRFTSNEREAAEKIFDDKLQELIKANAVQATSSEGVARRYEKMMDELTSTEKSRKVLHTILHDLVDDPSLKVVATQAISELLKLCPDLDLNRQDFVYDRPMKSYEYENERNERKNRLPTYLLPGMSGMMFTAISKVGFSPLNPLMVSALFSDHLMEFLLKQPGIDLTLPVYTTRLNHSSGFISIGLHHITAYTLASGTGRRRLEKAHYRQLLKELLAADPNKKLSQCLEGHKGVPLDPQAMGNMLYWDIMAQVNAKTSDEDKLQVLKEEYLKLPDNNSLLAQYLGSALNVLRRDIENQMGEVANKQKIPAPPTAAPTVSSRSINADNNPDEAGPSSGFGAKLKGLFHKK